VSSCSPAFRSWRINIGSSRRHSSDVNTRFTCPALHRRDDLIRLEHSAFQPEQECKAMMQHRPRDDVFYPAHVARRDESMPRSSRKARLILCVERATNSSITTHFCVTCRNAARKIPRRQRKTLMLTGSFLGASHTRRAMSANLSEESRKRFSSSAGDGFGISFVEISTTVAAAADRRGAGPLLLRGKKRCEIISHHIPLIPIAMREFSQKSRTTRRRPARRRCTSSPRPTWPCGGGLPAGCGR
jgi:hypothetical protein